MPEREMGMKKIFNIENLTINTCCPEQPTNCNAIITGLEVSEELTFSVTTTGSQGWNVRVGLYSASLGTYFYADWQVNGINTFVFEIADLRAYFEAQDLQFVVEVSNGDNEDVCDQTFVPLFNTSQVVEYTETGEIELVPELTPGVTCAGTLTHSIIYNNGELFDSADLSIDEAGNGTLELGGLPLADENGIILIGYYCDGILVAILAVNLTLLMFDVRVLGTDVDCEDEVLTATFVITNMGTNTIPSGTEFDYEFPTDPELTEVVGQVKSGTYTLLADLAPTETITMSIEYENPDCLTGSDITLTITVPEGYGNFNPATLTDDITYEYVAPPMGLRLGFKVDIANAPVADPTSVSDWNTFFNLPTNGTPFTSVIVSGLEAKLIGGGNLIVKNSAFQSSTAIDYVVDETGVIIEVGVGSFANVTMSEFTANSMSEAGSSAFSGATISIFNATGLQNAGNRCFEGLTCSTFNAPNIETMGSNCFLGSTIAGAYTFNSLLTTGDRCFNNAANITALTMPILTALGGTAKDDMVFFGMTALTAVTVPTALATANAGNPDGDLVYAVGTLGATVTYV